MEVVKKSLVMLNGYSVLYTPAGVVLKKLGLFFNTPRIWRYKHIKHTQKDLVLLVHT